MPPAPIKQMISPKRKPITNSGGLPYPKPMHWKKFTIGIMRISEVVKDIRDEDEEDCGTLFVAVSICKTAKKTNSPISTLTPALNPFSSCEAIHSHFSSIRLYLSNLSNIIIWLDNASKTSCHVSSSKIQSNLVDVADSNWGGV
jgi:hypothetical protein